MDRAIEEGAADRMFRIISLYWRMARPLQLTAVILVYSWGASMALATPSAFQPLSFFAGLAPLLLISASIHYANEYADYETDALTQRTPFSGGSGALQAHGAPRQTALRAAWLSLGGGLLLALLAYAAGRLSLISLGLLAAGTAGGWFYSLPPPALAWRGWGEAANALLGGMLLPAFGFSVQVGSLHPPGLLLSVPFTLLVFLNLLATTWPDRQADRRVGKRTLATRWPLRRLRALYFGAGAAAYLAILVTPAGVAAAGMFWSGLLLLPLTMWAALAYTRQRSPFPSVLVMTLYLLVQLAQRGLILLEVPLMTEDEMNGTPPQTAVPVVRSGRLGDVLIRLREALLDRLAGVNAALVVNTVVDQSAPPPSFDLAAQIKNVLTDLKGKAMDAGGDRVAYAALRRDPAYAAYRQTYHPALRRFDPASLSPAAARAFWINLYNALVIDAVLAFNVQTSVVEGFTGLLTFFRRAAYVVGGQRVSLEDMEHGILRGNRGNPYAPGAHFATADPRLAWALPVDPRLHFALNCGGRSCPPIRVYTPDRLDQQLDLAAKGYLETAVVLRADGALVLPQILRWFAADFGGQAGVLRFLEAYLPDADRRRLLSSNAPRIAYAPYDWRLNVL